MKQIKTTTIVKNFLLLLVLNLLMGCQNFVKSQKTILPNGYTNLYISLEDTGRTVMPEIISLSDLSFKLLGSKNNEPKEVLQTWNKSTDIPLSAITLKSGTWNFTMNAYSAGKLVLTSTKENIFLQGESKNIKFDLDEPDELLGSVDVTFEFPVGTGNIPSAKKIVAKFIRDSDEEVEVDSQMLIPEDVENDDTKQFVRYQNLNVDGGYYFLRFYIYQLENVDYTNFHSTYIRVEPGLESKGKEAITTIDRRHKLTLDLNGGTWNENITILNDFSETTETKLPIAAASFESEYWTNATLDGWYKIPEDGNLTEVQMITTLPAGIKENITLYAKWTITCEEKDIQAAFDNFSEGRFDIKLTTFVVGKDRVEGVSNDFLPIEHTLDNSNKIVSLDFSVAYPEKEILYSGWYTRYIGKSINFLTLPNFGECYASKEHYYIGSKAFIGCENIKNVIYPNTKENWSRIKAKGYWGDGEGNICIKKWAPFCNGVKIIFSDNQEIVFQAN